MNIFSSVLGTAAGYGLFRLGVYAGTYKSPFTLLLSNILSGVCLVGGVAIISAATIAIVVTICTSITELWED